MATKYIGPAPKEVRAIAEVMDQMEIPENQRPTAFKNKLVAKSKRDPLGQISVYSLTGVKNNVAKRLVQRFEENTKGRDDVIEKLEAVEEELSEDNRALLELLRTSHKTKSLARLVAEAGASPTGLMRSYAKGCVMLAQVEAAIAAHEGMPHLIKDLYRHALDQKAVCQTCVGSGRVRHRSGEEGVMVENWLCPACDGEGKTLVVSKSKEFAARNLLEMTQMVGKKEPLVQVNNNNVNVGGGGGFMERQMELIDKVLHRKADEVVEAEVVSVQPEGD